MNDIFFELKKSDEESRMVWGYASTEALDSDGEVITREAVSGAWDDYMKFGNLREMHQPSAVGTVQEHMLDPVGAWIGAKVVDDAAWEKVREGVYKGFSIGGRITERDEDDATKVTGLKLHEISLVDRPANPEAVITLFKAAETTPEESAEVLASVVTSLESLVEQSRTDRELLGKLQDSVAELHESLGKISKAEETPMAEENVEKAETVEEVEKAAEATPDAAPAAEPVAEEAEVPAADDGIAKSLAAVVEVLDGINKRLERLEGAPLGSPAALKSIGKAADVEDGDPEPEPEDALGAIKKVHGSGAGRLF